MSKIYYKSSSKVQRFTDKSFLEESEQPQSNPSSFAIAECQKEELKAASVTWNFRMILIIIRHHHYKFNSRFKISGFLNFRKKKNHNYNYVLFNTNISFPHR